MCLALFWEKLVFECSKYLEAYFAPENLASHYTLETKNRVGYLRIMSSVWRIWDRSLWRRTTLQNGRYTKSRFFQQIGRQSCKYHDGHSSEWESNLPETSRDQTIHYPVITVWRFYEISLREFNPDRKVMSFQFDKSSFCDVCPTVFLSKITNPLIFRIFRLVLQESPFEVNFWEIGFFSVLWRFRLCDYRFT